MGWDCIEYRIVVTTDAHGGVKEAAEEKLSQEFIQEIAKVCRQYSSIVTYFSGENEQ